MTKYGGLLFASIENDSIRLDYLTTTGPRIVGLYVSGVDGNLLASTPEVHWETPHGEYYLRGGHRLWTAPEDPFYTCPENDLEVVESENSVVLRSPVDASGLEKEITIQLNENCVYLSQKVTWHGDEPITFAPWSITQLRLGSMGILPMPVDDHGLAPNRNLVLWPYTSLKDERLELHDDFVLLHGKGTTHAAKIGYRNTLGWIACVLGDALFVKRFELSDETLPDMGCNVEAYVKDVCAELETLGPLVQLKKGESVTHKESWLVFAGDYPATLDCVRKVKEQLSQPVMYGV